MAATPTHGQTDFHWCCGQGPQAIMAKSHLWYLTTPYRLTRCWSRHAQLARDAEHPTTESEQGIEPKESPAAIRVLENRRSGTGAPPGIARTAVLSAHVESGHILCWRQTVDTVRSALPESLAGHEP